MATIDDMYMEWLAEEQAAWEQEQWESQLDKAYREHQDREYALWLAEQPEPADEPEPDEEEW